MMRRQEQLPEWVHVPQDAREPELELHALRQLSVGSALRVQAHDAGLLGEPLPNGARVGLNFVYCNTCLRERSLLEPQ